MQEEKTEDRNSNSEYDSKSEVCLCCYFKFKDNSSLFPPCHIRVTHASIWPCSVVILVYERIDKFIDEKTWQWRWRGVSGLWRTDGVITCECFSLEHARTPLHEPCPEMSDTVNPLSSESLSWRVRKSISSYSHEQKIKLFDAYLFRDGCRWSIVSVLHLSDRWVDINMRVRLSSDHFIALVQQLRNVHLWPVENFMVASENLTNILN